MAPVLATRSVCQIWRRNLCSASSFCRDSVTSTYTPHTEWAEPSGRSQRKLVRLDDMPLAVPFQHVLVRDLLSFFDSQNFICADALRLFRGKRVEAGLAKDVGLADLKKGFESTVGQLKTTLQILQADRRRQAIHHFPHPLFLIARFQHHLQVHQYQHGKKTEVAQMDELDELPVDGLVEQDGPEKQAQAPGQCTRASALPAPVLAMHA